MPLRTEQATVAHRRMTVIGDVGKGVTPPRYVSKAALL